MGIGLCEYRATIGAFAWIATNAGLHWRGKSKQQKSSKLRAVGGKARCEKGQSSNSDNVQKRWGSLDGRKTRNKSKYIGRRSKTLKLRHRSRQQLSFRPRSGVMNKARHSGATELLLEQAIFTIVQMLLIRSGVETNPGPTTPTSSSSCCNASQHFNWVKNTIAEAQRSFRSKVTQDTLTKKVLEIEETGNYSTFSPYLKVLYFPRFEYQPCAEFD